MQTSYAIEEATRPLWLGRTPGAWGDLLRTVRPDEAHDAAAMVARRRVGLDGLADSH